MDFEAYSIPDYVVPDKKSEQIKDDERIWRISSLTAFIDSETKILLLPLPESKRKVKIQDTFYSFKTYEDLYKKNFDIVNELSHAKE